VSPIFPITKILVIEDNELHGTFFYVAFRSQSWLRIMSDLTRSDTNGRTERGNRREVNGSLITFFCKNWPMSYVQSPKPKYFNKVMNTPTNSI
jgi:hypothetical protein